MPVFRVDRKERRKEIPGYGGRYVVSDLGKVYSNGCELSLIRGRYVNLSRSGEITRADVGYLVARAFLSNLRGCEWIRHKDGNWNNNRVENLEWTHRRPGRNDGRALVNARPIVQYDLEGNCVGRYESVRKASEKTGVARSLIRNCAEGKARRAKKWVFRYA